MWPLNGKIGKDIYPEGNHDILRITQRTANKLNCNFISLTHFYIKFLNSQDLIVNPLLVLPRNSL